VNGGNGGLDSSVIKISYFLYFAKIINIAQMLRGQLPVGKL
jgi:hypothetical protein